MKKYFFMRIMILLLILIFTGCNNSNTSHITNTADPNNTTIFNNKKGRITASIVPAAGFVPTDEQVRIFKDYFESRLLFIGCIDKTLKIDYVSKKIYMDSTYENDYWAFKYSDLNQKKVIKGLLKHICTPFNLTFRNDDGKILLSSDDIKSTKAIEFPKETNPALSIKFTKEGSKKFANTTKRLIGYKISIFIDETLISDFTVKTKINSGKYIIDDIPITDTDQVYVYSMFINNGPLPYKANAVDIKIVTPEEE